MPADPVRHGGGCACKIPPGELEDMVRGLTGIDRRRTCSSASTTATTRPRCGSATAWRCSATADFFTPVVDDAYDWGRIAAANALSDIYAMGGRPVVAVNLLGWPRDVLPLELAAEVLRGGLDVARAGRLPGGRRPQHRRPRAEVRHGRHRRRPTRTACCATTPPAPGLPLSLTKPLGVGVLNNRHKATGEVFAQAVASMAALNDAASRDAARGRRRGRPPT